jgi:hypothetical protein
MHKGKIIFQGPLKLIVINVEEFLNYFSICHHQTFDLTDLIFLQSFVIIAHGLISKINYQQNNFGYR